MVIKTDDSVTIEGLRTMAVQAGELKVPRNELLTPARLRMLALQGWSVVSARPLKQGGFSMLLQRELEDESEEDYEPIPKIIDIHVGSPRCPGYCNCISNAINSGIFTHDMV